MPAGVVALMSTVTYRVIRHWSIREGDWYYAVYRFTDWGDTTTISQVATGGEEWAKNNAERFGVKIEDEKEIDGQYW